MDINDYRKIDVTKFKNLSDFIEYKRNVNTELYNKYFKAIKDQSSDSINMLADLQRQYDMDQGKVNKSFTTYTYEMPKDYSAGPEIRETRFESQAPEAAPPAEEINDIFAVRIDDPRRLERLRILYDNKGVVYRFNRGIAVIGPDGRKINEVFDRTRNHHTPTLARISREVFGIDVLYDEARPALFETALDARNKGITAMCFEGGSCSIYLPDDITVEIIDAMLEEIEPRKNFVFICIKGPDKLVDVTWEEITSYLKGLRRKKEREEQTEEQVQPRKEEVDTSINEYINAVLRFIDEKDISLLDYYRLVGRHHRVRETSSLPEFEQKNPIVDENDIRLLQERKDDKIVEYFARAMFRLINRYVSKDHKNRVTIDGLYTGYPTYEKPSAKKQPEPPVTVSKISKEEYIKSVLEFVDEKNISLLEYYRNVGRQHRVKEADKLPDFELRNPFLDENDIKLLQERKDDKIVEYFARAMFKVVNINIARLKHKKHKTNPEEVVNKPIVPEREPHEVKKPHKPTELIEMFKKEKTHEYSITEEISFDRLDDYDGYVVVRDDENINIYTYDKDDKSKLTNRVTYPVKEFNIKNGYYVSLRDFLEELRMKYPQCETSFVTGSGIELDFETVIGSLSEYCLEQGGIRLQNKEGEFADDLYMNRKDLKTFLSKFKIKYTSKKEKEDSNRNVKGL